MVIASAVAPILVSVVSEQSLTLELAVVNENAGVETLCDLCRQVLVAPAATIAFEHDDELVDARPWSEQVESQLRSQFANLRESWEAMAGTDTAYATPNEAIQLFIQRTSGQSE